MTDPVTTLAPVSPGPAVTADHLQLIKATIAKDATPAELQLFLYDNARQGVHPLDKLIHFTKRSGKYTPITSIDFMRIRAAESGECAGIDDAIFVGTPKEKDFAAIVTVYRIVQGQRYPFTATARWTEYVPDQAFMWNKMPHTMLSKCAEALALRKAFPKQLSGLYSKEEMEQAGPPVSSGLPPGGRAASPEPGDAATAGRPADPPPADVNSDIPAAWAPFVEQPDRLRGRIVAIADETKTGKKSGKPFTKWSITLEGGETVTTLDRDFADTAIMAKHDGALVEIGTKDSRWGKDITGIGRIPEDRDGDVAF